MTQAAAWDTSLPDWEDRLMEGRSLIPDLPLFDAPAEKALAIFKRLRVPDLIGTPSYGEICEPWVFDLVRAIFGSYDPATKRRMLQEFFLLVPKKNGKSAIAAGIIVTAAIMNERPRAELLLIAPTQEIAQIAFRQAEGIVELDEVLAALFHVQSHLKQITHRNSKAVIKVLSADGNVVTGSKAAYVLIDETHVLGHQAKADAVFLELRGGLSSRPEGFLLQITTQSKTEPKGRFRKELQKARAVRDGRRQARMLAVLFEFPEQVAKSEAWRDPATWGLVNPNLERSVSLDYLTDQWAEAQASGPEDMALFASQHLNVEIGMGLHSERWRGADYWPACGSRGLTLDALLERSEVATVGADMGGSDDLSSLAVWGRCRETRKRLHWVGAWCHPDVLEIRKEIAPQLRDLEAAGELVIDADMDRHVADMVAVCERVREAGILPDEDAIGLDAWGVAGLIDALIEAGFTQEQIMAVRQGGFLSGTIKGLERRLVNGSVEHGDQMLMRFALANAKVETRGDNVLIQKARAGVAKIDPLIATLISLAVMDRNPEAPGGTLTPWDLDPDYRMSA